MIRVPPHIAQMSPYALAKMNAPVGKPLISLSQNECLRPPSQKVVKAAATVLAASALYPDPDWRDLRHALANLHDIDEENILCGNGSLDLIGCLARAYARPRRAVLAPAHAYPFFKTAAQMADARFDTAPETGTTVSVDALLEAVQPDTGLVFIANPGNPTGTRIPKAELMRLRASLRDDILLVIDEAYGEFVDHLGESSLDKVEAGNTVVLRTFSKAYAMAGFRVGWGLFPPAIALELRKVMNPNNISAASQAAARAALDDQAYMRETCALTSRLREQAQAQLRSAGFAVHSSFTNFILIKLSNTKAAQSADKALCAQGIILRRQHGAGLPHALRMTVGGQSMNAAAITHLELWKKRYRP